MRGDYFDDLDLLPELRAGLVSFPEFQERNQTWFGRLSGRWIQSLPDGCFISRDDLEQEALVWAWCYVFGEGNAKPYNLRCCDRTWETGGRYLRHRRRSHPGMLDVGFSRYVAYNVSRRVSHPVRAQYAQKRDVRSVVVLPGDISDWIDASRTEDGPQFAKVARREVEHLIDHLMIYDSQGSTIFDALVQRASEELDDHAREVLVRLLDGDLRISKSGGLKGCKGHRPGWGDEQALRDVQRAFAFLLDGSTIGGERLPLVS